jgi:hypothetical protein
LSSATCACAATTSSRASASAFARALGHRGLGLGVAARDELVHLAAGLVAQLPGLGAQALGLLLGLGGQPHRVLRRLGLGLRGGLALARHERLRLGNRLIGGLARRGRLRDGLTAGDGHLVLRALRAAVASARACSAGGLHLGARGLLAGGQRLLDLGQRGGAQPLGLPDHRGALGGERLLARGDLVRGALADLGRVGLRALGHRRALRLELGEQLLALGRELLAHPGDLGLRGGVRGDGARVALLLGGGPGALGLGPGRALELGHTRLERRERGVGVGALLLGRTAHRDDLGAGGLGLPAGGLELFARGLGLGPGALRGARGRGGLGAQRLGLGAQRVELAARGGGLGAGTLGLPAGRVGLGPRALGAGPERVELLRVLGGRRAPPQARARRCAGGS